MTADRGEAAQTADERLARMEAELDEARRMVRERAEFLARLSHEIRSALASMVGFADMLHEEVPEAQRELAGHIGGSGRHLLETLNAVLDLARIEARQEEVERHPVDVAVRARDRVRLFEPAARRKGLRLDLRVEDEPATALLNPTLLDRVLHNLIDNAVKYTREGRVEVSVETREGFVWIYVADTGVGIDRAFLPRLFAPFERESADAAEGTGLGLSITRQLVELMDGRIFACSTKGHGSTFTVQFPDCGSGAGD